MSARIELNAKDLKQCFNSISLIAAKGSQLTPVSLKLADNKLIFTCLQGCVVQTYIEVPYDEKIEMVFMYYDVTPILPSIDSVFLEIESEQLTISGPTFSCAFPMGFGDATCYDFSDCTYTKFGDVKYLDGLKTVMGMGLDKLYGKDVPLSVYGDVTVLKHACCYVQTRTIGLPFTAQIEAVHAKILTKLLPWEVSTSQQDTLVFRKQNTILQIPCRYGIPGNNFTEFLKGMVPKCKITLGSSFLRLRDMSKVSTKTKCSLIGYKEGLSVTLSVENANSSIIIGKDDGDIQFVFDLPIQVILTFIKALGSGVVEILTGGDLICFRTQSLIILVRVEY